MARLGNPARATALVSVALVALVWAAPAAAGRDRPPELTVLSSAPDLVTGGDALIEVRLPARSRPSRLRVRRNGVGVTGVFSPVGGRARLLSGVVDGLRPGANRITARVGSGRPGELELFETADTGPLFSGPQQSPFYCRTEAAGLGPPGDGACSAPTTVEYRYRGTDGEFHPLADPASRPPDLAQTTTRDGETVDFVVRIETGVINRSIYRWAILAPGGVIGPGWNERLIHSFGGGCGAGYQQGELGRSTVMNADLLSRGYSVTGASLTVLATACNDVLSAETLSMVKEHVIESLGRAPAWTLGEGGSGGSIQQQLIAQNYPGLLDGLMPSASFPDAAAPDYPDCRLLQTYYATPAGAALSDAQREAISGLAVPDGCAPLAFGADVVNAGEGCDETVVPPAVIFDPVSNPTGIRCTVFDSMVNVYGRDPETGYARRTLDNVGVQYGLLALREGELSIGEFLDLNQGIGGYDDNGELVARRSVADPEALAIAYRTGRINQGGGGIADVPILDLRHYVDDETNVHQYINTYRFRARLDAINGGHANHVMFRAAGGPNVAAMREAGIETIAAWLDRIEADGTDRPLAEKVIANKPADAVDACWTGAGQRTNGVAAIGATNLCETTYPPHALPVDRAGRPLGSVAAKCALRPLDQSQYGPLTPDQAARLRATFPDGVCDYSRPGVGEQPLAGTWQEFGPQRVVERRRRRLRLQPSRARVAQGARVILTASLRPCPASSWQRVRFEARRHGRWHSVGAGYASGPRCRAARRVRVTRQTAFRARARPLAAFRGATSKLRRVRLLR